MMGGAPTLLSLFSIIINNLWLNCYVRTTVREGQLNALETEKELASYRSHQQVRDVPTDNPNDMDSIAHVRASVLTSSEKQWKRVRDVLKQSFLSGSAFAFVLLDHCKASPYSLKGLKDRAPISCHHLYYRPYSFQPKGPLQRARVLSAQVQASSSTAW